jgi:hypothetical protein
VIRSRIKRSVVHVAHVGERRGVYRVWWEDLRVRDHLETLCENEKDSIKIVLLEVVWWHGQDRSGSG